MNVKSEPVKKLLKRYKNEWLLIDVDNFDKRTLVPKTGRLVAHSPHKTELSDTYMNHKGRIYRVFSGPPFPPGVRVVF